MKGYIIRHVVSAVALLCSVSMAAQISRMVRAFTVSNDGGYTYIDDTRAHVDSIVLKSRVVESIAKRDLKDAFLIPIDTDGNAGDTIHADSKFSFIDMHNHRVQHFVEFMAARKDSTYVFEIGCPGYTSQTIVYGLKRIGKREYVREMPMTVLERAPYKLKEVEVVASKVKFYHRGDTLVYNADAFQLAEGSMLDELIRQLPGVELNNDGEIKVNGEKVESLLLNGKHFFDGDNNLMLENLGAYTVKDVEVYRGQTALEKWIDDPNAKKHLTMDVKLKKEYSMGYMGNLQGGYGTEGRYLGRLFASWYNNNARVTLVGNMNNVGDYFSPRGVEDTWRPSTMGGNGDSRRHTVGLNYNIDSQDQTRTGHGSVTYNGNRSSRYSASSTSTYYADNSVFAHNFNNSLGHGSTVNTQHELMFDLGRTNISAQVSGSYSSNDQNSSALSASFNREQADISQEIIENIYDGDNKGALEAMINRSRTRADSDTRQGDGSIGTTAMYKIPGTSDILQLRLSGRYSSSKSDSWNDYDIDYGNNSTTPAERRRQYSDNSPNHNMNLEGNVTYSARIGKTSLDLNYGYSYSDNKTDSYMYELQNLADMGDYGTLPPDYLSAFSPANSYMSRQREGRHVVSPMLRYELRSGGGNTLSLDVAPALSFSNRRLDYWRDNKLYNIRHTSTLREALSGSVSVSYYPASFYDPKRSSNSFSYSYSLSSSLPSMLSLVDITDDSNPLYIREGNPCLKSTQSHHHSLSWRTGGKFSNSVDLSYSYEVNSVTQASTYDMKTGVTRSRAENINGNNSIGISDYIHYWFGRDGNFSLTANTRCERMHSVDLLGVNGEEPTLTKADTWSIRENVRLDFRFGRGHSLAVSCDAVNRRTDSDRADFNKINAFHIDYGVRGQVKLPAGFSLNTSFKLYTRRGYGSKELDTTDAIWNAGASFAPEKHKRWLFTIAAYDLLHQVSSIHYSVTATGKSVTYVNSIPRYVLATVQYKFNIMPKNKKNNSPEIMTETIYFD